LIETQQRLSLLPMGLTHQAAIRVAWIPYALLSLYHSISLFANFEKIARAISLSSNGADRLAAY
jgi:hypothetical protein